MTPLLTGVLILAAICSQSRWHFCCIRTQSQTWLSFLMVAARSSTPDRHQNVSKLDAESEGDDDDDDVDEYDTARLPF